MNKKIQYTMEALALILTGFIIFSVYTNKETPKTDFMGTGTVLSIDLEQAMVDGPVVIVISTEEGEKTIHVPSMGLPMCQAFNDIADVYSLKQGDTLSVYGAINPETGAITPCENSAHYLRANEERASYTNEEFGFFFSYRKDPLGYVLTEAPSETGEENSPKKILLLMLGSDYKELQESTIPREAPPTMSILVFSNPEKLSPENWAVKNKSWSNIELKIGDIKNESLSGADAIHYTADGLYHAHTIVATQGDYVYVLIGNYLEEGSPIYKDFKTLSTSFTFLSSR